MVQLTKESFSFPAVGLYEYDGKQINIVERLSGFGSGRKTVYSAIIGDVTYSRRDILFYKKLFSIIPGGVRGPRKTAAALVAAPVATPVEPSPAPAPAVVPAPAASGVIRHQRFNFLRRSILDGLAPYIWGPAGSGKNVVAQQLADDLGLTFYYSNSVTQEYKVAGFVDAAGRFHETEFYRAFTNGGLFMLDELDASCADVLTLLNAALANKYFVFEDIGRVNMHPDFHCIAAGNTVGTGADEMYTGRQVIDAASLNRFIAVPFGYDPAVEEKVAGGVAGLLDFVRALRDSAKICGLSLVLGYRNIIYLRKLSSYVPEGLCTMFEAVQMSCFPAVDLDGVRNLVANYKGDRKNTFFQAIAANI